MMSLKTLRSEIKLTKLELSKEKDQYNQLRLRTQLETLEFVLYWREEE